MKKFLNVMAVSLILAATFVSKAFAESTFHIGAYAPFSSVTTDDEFQNEFKISESGLGFTFDFTHVAESGFTVAPELSIGYLRAKSDWIPTLADKVMDGMDIEWSVGLGGSFIHNEKTTFSWLGKLGHRIQYCDIAENIGTVNEINGSLFVLWWSVGTEFAYTHRFTERFGFFINVAFFCNIGVTIYEADDVSSNTYDMMSDGVGAALTVQPKAGISITL